MNKLLMIVLCLGFIGCAHVDYQTHMNLQYGMTKASVLSVLGPPSQRELYRKRNETLVEYLMYRDFVPYEDLTPICFIDNKLVGWGKTFYQDHVSLDDLRLK